MGKDRGERNDPKRASGIRTFICIEIPETIRVRIAALQNELRQAEAQVSWTKPSNIHLSLKFLGDVPASRIESVLAATGLAAAAHGAFEIEVRGAGCFPSPRSPRVLWVGVSGGLNPLRELQASIEDELARSGFAREPKPFSPHLTIGRVRPGRTSSQVAEELMLRRFEPESFRAGAMIVMRSDLNPAGSIYTPLGVVPLGK